MKTKEILEVIDQKGSYTLSSRSTAYEETSALLEQLKTEGQLVEINRYTEYRIAGDNILYVQVSTPLKIKEQQQRLSQFKSELKALLEKYGATISFEVSDCSDTHGLNDEKMVVTIDNKSHTISQGWDIDPSDFGDENQ